MFTTNEAILSEYENSTGDHLIIADKIDYYLLSRLFVERFTQVKYEHLYDAIQGVRERQGTGMANWGMKSLVEDV